jgi:nicotinamide-nucleotide amidase
MTDAELGARLLARGWWVATAESCTGGRVAARITSQAGSSGYFAGGVVAYANRVKEALLGVDGAALAREGAVSGSVAGQMAAGARRLLHVDVAVATTGIAGPGGGSDEKPVGTVFVAVAAADGVRVQRRQFDGDRAAVQQAATDAALTMLGQTVATVDVKE